MATRGKIIFTEYAESQIIERKIAREDVINVLQSPEQITVGRKGRKIAQSKLKKGGQDGLLRIIFEEENKINKIVITVYWTSKVQKYWR
ncbi:MAG: DUF4258 domain-containing protein [Candidatus Omnitrophica bacterium]|nr:DUF4258 domain-containing protein [Candidatus Omnitrophota bacterium]